MAGETQDGSVWRRWHADDIPIRIGVSSCLLGNEVRYDGGHKHDRYLTGVLGEWVEWESVCPEMEGGMGVPRPTIRLERDGDGDRLIEPDSGTDYSDAMARFARTRVRQLSKDGIDGFILKRGSPSCGMERVKVWAKGAPAHKRGVGHFARSLMASNPDLPVEEEGRLNDVPLRDHFIERVFCRNRWRILRLRRLSRKKLVAFHTAHKMLLRSHDEKGYRALGRLIGELGTRPDREIFVEYETAFMETMSRRATVSKHVNVMHHIMGYLKRDLAAENKRLILSAIEDYRGGLLPITVPLSLLRYEVESRGIDYVRGQLYLEPHPRELMLRNHA